MSPRILFDTPQGLQRKLIYAALSAIALACAIAYAVKYGSPIFPVDDAYISLHSAEALYHGGDNRYLGTPALIGATSPVHVVITTALLPFLKPLWAHFVAMWLGALAYLLMLARLAFAVGGGPLEALLLVATGVIFNETPHQLLNGLETGWAMAGVTWALACASERPARRVWELPVACGVLPFLRPELVALSGPLMLLRAWDDVRSAKSAREFFRSAARDLGWLAAGAGPWMILMLWNTGALLPVTVQAKRNYFSEGCLPEAVRREWTQGSLVRFKNNAGPFVWAAALLLLHRAGRLALAFVGVFIFAYYKNFPGGLGHYEQRYMYVLVPILFLGPLALTALRRAHFRVASALVLCMLIYHSSQKVKLRWQEHLNYCGFTRGELAAVATWLNEHVPRDAKVLVHDAGYVGYAARVKLADFVGLKTPASLPVHDKLTWKSCGGLRGEALHQIALKERPDYLVLLSGWNNIYGLSWALVSRGWRLQEVRKGDYEIYEISPPVK